MTQAFEGIRILDFSQVLAAPFAVMQLALLGAEVIKIEQPGTGDQTRGLMTTGNNGMAPSFMGMNLNKRSLTLNLKDPRAVRIVRELAATADVVVENFKAGTMERLGLDYDTLRTIREDLIYCSVTGYGQTGPRAGDAAYDGAIQAASGMMSQTGHPSTGPTRTGYMPVDMSTALNTAFAISAALFRRERTGAGQRLDVAMMDTALVVQAAQYSNYLNQGTLVGLMGNASPTRQPTANVFSTADGYIQITALRQPQVEKLFTAIGREDALASHPFDTPEARVANPEAVTALINEALAARDTHHWMGALSALGVPVAEVRELPDVLEEEQLRHRDVFETLASPIEPGENIRVVKAGYMADRDGPLVHRGPPLLGEHTDAILEGLGYSADAIESLRQDGVC